MAQSEVRGESGGDSGAPAPSPRAPATHGRAGPSPSPPGSDRPLSGAGTRPPLGPAWRRPDYLPEEAPPGTPRSPARRRRPDRGALLHSTAHGHLARFCSAFSSIIYFTYDLCIFKYFKCSKNAFGSFLKEKLNLEIASSPPVMFPLPF